MHTDTRHTHDTACDTRHTHTFSQAEAQMGKILKKTTALKKVRFLTDNAQVLGRYYIGQHLWAGSP